MKRVLIAAVLLMMALSQFGCARGGMSRAAIDGDLQAVKNYASQGDSVNSIDKWGWTPLLWSVYYGNFPVTKWLLDNGADPNIKSQQEYGNYLPGTTPLILAAAYGRDDAVKALLAKKADAAVVDRKGKRAIDYAEQYQFDKVVALLKHHR